MTENEIPEKPKKVKKTVKLKFGKLSAKNAKTTKQRNVDPDNKQAAGIVGAMNTTGLDTEHLGNVGKFVKMGDEELMKEVPTGGKGQHNKLTEDERDSRMVLVHRLHLRGLTNQEIATQLGVSSRMIAKIKVQIQDMHKRSFTNVDLNEWLGGTMAFFDEVRNMGMLIASTSTEKTTSRLMALKVAESAELSKAKFLDYCGIFSHVRAQPNLLTGVIDNHLVDGEEHDAVASAMDAFALELFSQ